MAGDEEVALSASAERDSRDKARESESAQADADAAGPAATDDSLSADAVAVWDALNAFAQSARGFVIALLGLARSEWKLAKASLPFVFAFTVVLVGLSLSLWASLIALAAWGLYVLTSSVGWALAALAGLHVVLLFIVRWLLKRASHNMTMPATRSELHGLADRAKSKIEGGQIDE